MHCGTEMNASQFGIKGQRSGHGGITYAGTITVQADAYSSLLDVSCRVKTFYLHSNFRGGLQNACVLKQSA